MTKKHYTYLLLGTTLSLVFLLNCAEQNQIDSKQILSKFQTAYNNHDTAAIAQLYAKDAVYIVSGESEPILGREAIEESYVPFYRAFPDIKVEFKNILASGDQFCAEWTMIGTNTGPLATPDGDLPPTGQSVKIKGAFFGKGGRSL